MFQRFFDEGLAQASYLIGCERTREAVIVDPRRDVDVYVTAARQHGLTIVSAIETHVHADFVSGSRELAGTGARLIAGPGAALEFEHHEVRHGERGKVGDTSLEFLHTPGHTPEHIAVLVGEPGQPSRLLTGDLLFVGAVGRPDLLGEDRSRQLAHQLYDSLFGIVLSLDDAVEVHPGHGAGSLCGAGIGEAPHSTIGQERHFNPMLQHTTKESFVAAVLADLPETPSYFPRMKRVNKQGPAILGLTQPVHAPARTSAPAAADAISHGAVVLDVRAASAFGAGHPAGAINITYGSKVGYWAGWVLPADARIVLLMDDTGDGQAAEIRRQLLRVGLDDLVGVIDGGIEGWLAAGLPIRQTPQMTVWELSERLAHGEPLTVLDVRTRREWKSGHIETALNVPVGDLPNRVPDVPTGNPVLTICEGGFRSSLASSLLERAGLDPVINVTGGMAAYRALEHTT